MQVHINGNPPQKPLYVINFNGYQVRITTRSNYWFGGVFDGLTDMPIYETTGVRMIDTRMGLFDYILWKVDEEKRNSAKQVEVENKNES